MKTFLAQLEMPLLTRELKELAASKRTYIIRFVYAATLFAMACAVLFQSRVSTGGMGRGREMFLTLVKLQFWGMVILVPATTAGVITVEKERDALGVLMLTTLGSFRIMLQKLLSRLVPMFSFLLLGMPLLAVAYSYGGVPDGTLTGGILLLFVSAANLAVISLFCSAWSTTTSQALLSSWVLFAVSYFVLSPLWLPSVIDYQGNAFPVIQAAIVYGCIASTIGFIFSVPCLTMRAFATSENYTLRFFKVLDGFFNEANAITGGIVLVRDQNKTPLFHPVAWRETARKSLGTFRYQFRVLACLEIPILFICQLVNLNESGANSMQMALFTLWSITLLLVAVHGAGLVSSERSRQTLSVLLSTPITGSSLLHQKWTGLRRMLYVLFVPFFSIYAFQAWFFLNKGIGYLVISSFSYVVLVSLAAWLSIWIGLRVKSQMRAILTSIGAIAFIALCPYGIQMAMRQSGQPLSDWFSVISPAEMVMSLEFNSNQWLTQHLSHAVGFLFVFAALGVVCRLACNYRIDQCFGRVPTNYKPNQKFQPPSHSG